MVEHNNSEHKYFTRSKTTDDKIDNHDLDIIDDMDDIDNYGNLKDFIDYDCEEDLDVDMLKDEISRLNGDTKRKKMETENIDKKTTELFFSYIMMNALAENFSPSNRSRKKKLMKNLKNKDNKKKINNKKDDKKDDKKDIIEDNNNNNNDNIDILEEIINEDIETSSSSDISLEITSDSESESLSEENLKDSESVSESVSDSDYGSDDGLDQYEEEFLELTTLDDEEDKELEYFSKLSDDSKESNINQLKLIKQINDTDTPLRFKVLNSDMSLKSKSIAISNIDKLEEMDASSDEYYKMNKWINGLIKIPFGETIHLPVNDTNTIQEKRDFIVNTKKTLDEAIYGHNEAKNHILQVIGKWIKNPKSQGNVLAIQGPMGNGKTTLVKQGISKAIDRPFAFIALGGASDSAFFDGHSYTYIGSHWGRVVDILIESKCMNPVIYFDELDKVSETYKGDEIINLLTHLTDPSQNNVFQDNYFPGIELDLSKALFIFSFNEEEKVNRILKDRMYVINTKGFKTDDKLSITRDYLLPELLDTFVFDKEELIFPDNTVKIIIEKYTMNEQGVRNLKRCLETIISKINIYNLSYDKNNDNKENIDLEFKLDDFSLPFTITEEIAEKLLNLKKNDDKPPEHMYM
jgi:ATP-dependent Lon protease